jgi:thiamine biosynthesis lipoprotein
MGTIARVDLVAEDERTAADAAEEVRRVFDRVNATMSNWSPDSELSKLNREAGRGGSKIVDADLAACIAAGLDAARKTGGAFDPTVGPLMTAWGFRPRSSRVPTDPEIEILLERVGASKVHLDPSGPSIRFDRDGMEIDLGGIAKGYAVDLARRALAGRPVSGLIDLSGNLGWLPARPGDVPPIAGIKDPSDPDRVIAQVRLRPGAALATSSDVENHRTVDGKTIGHIMDARTGRPAETDVVQATAIHPSATVADVLSTALFVGGSRGAAEVLAAYPGAEAVLIVREDGRLAILASASLQGRLSDLHLTGAPRFVLPAATISVSRAR